MAAVVEALNSCCLSEITHQICKMFLKKEAEHESLTSDQIKC